MSSPLYLTIEGFFCVNQFVTKGLASFILKLKGEALKEDFRLHWQEIRSDGIVILSNPKKQKACFIASAGDDNLIVSYVIHVRKFLWAEEEGFTREDMIEKLGEEVFEEIPPEKIIDNLK